MARKEYGTQWGKMITSISPAYIKKGYRYLKRHGMKQFLIRLTERFQQEDIDYETWFGLNKATEKELQEQRKNPPEHGPIISIVVPVYRTPEIYLREMIESVVNQTYGNWELCLADASPKGEQLRQDLKKIKGRKTREALMKIPDGDTELTSVIREYQLKDSRIRYEILKENKSIAENSNAAMEMATGDFVGLLDHDDTLEPNALYEVARKICEDDRVDVVYTDEDKINSK